jgi:penicillin-binding protein 1C
LPPRLRRLDPGPLASASSETGGLRIVYPPDGALIEWHGEELPLEAAGGKRPLQWLVDGKPLPADLPRRPVYWLPEGIGYVQLTVIDAQGRSAHSTARLSP